MLNILFNILCGVAILCFLGLIMMVIVVDYHPNDDLNQLAERLYESLSPAGKEKADAYLDKLLKEEGITEDESI